MCPALLSAVTEHLLVTIHLAQAFTGFLIGKSERKVIRARFQRTKKGFKHLRFSKVILSCYLKMQGKHLKQVSP